MRDVKKCISNNIIDNSTNVSVHTYYGSQRGDTSPEIEKEEVSIKQLVKGKAIENIVGFALMGIGGITKKFKLIEKLQLIDDRVDMIVEIVVLFLCIVAGVVIIVTSIIDLIKIYMLSKKDGQFVEFESKIDWASQIISFFYDSNVKEEIQSRHVGKCYKNINGKIYIIKGAICPFCETKPIGHMELRYSAEVYFWKCSQNPAHIIEFDYKKEF